LGPDCITLSGWFLSNEDDTLLKKKNRSMRVALVTSGVAHVPPWPMVAARGSFPVEFQLEMSQLVI